MTNANKLYDQGSAKFRAKQYAQGSSLFKQAADDYASAWTIQSSDPSVGTDYATSLFYSGNTNGAIAQVDKVLAMSPQFQPGWFNKGNYLADQARQAQKAGDKKAAAAGFAAARTAYQKAVNLGADTATGKDAQQLLDRLPR